MAIQSQPSRISEPFAGSGSKNVIPATNSTPSASQAASWASGFPPECSQPISAGGCPVPRDDMNGIFNQLSQDYTFRQDGGVWEWSASADYDLQRIVRGSDGVLYFSAAQSGPGLASGAKDPTADDGTYWSALKTATMPASDSSKATATTEWVNAWDAAQQPASRIYVNGTSGNDSNSGLSPSTAKKTIAGAVSYYQNMTRPVYKIVGIRIAPGTYPETLVAVDGIYLYYTAPDGAVTCEGANIGRGQGLALGGTFIFTDLLRVSRTGILQLGTTTSTTSLTFSNLSAVAALEAFSGGQIFVYESVPVSVDFAGCTFSRAALYVTAGSIFANYGTMTWSGSVTGKNYSAIGCSVIRGIGSPTAIPGTVSGTIDSTSYFS